VKATAKPSGRRRPPQPGWRRQWPLLLTAGIIVVVIAVFAFLAAHQQAPTAAPDTTAKVIGEVTSPNGTVASTVGTGGVANPLKSSGGQAVLQDASGKPEVLYIGAEYCPFCAAERWSLIYALSRFGSFHGLLLSTSSSTDAYPDTPTFSFRTTTYQSSVLAFVPVETADRQGNSLGTITASQQSLLQRFDAAGSIPFLDLGNSYYEVGAGFQPDVLSGLSWDQVAAQLSDPGAASTKAIVGNANYLTAAICKLTAGQPAATCSDPAIARIAAGLG
jgi:Domain of unknown function (DUF929)